MSSATAHGSDVPVYYFVPEDGESESGELNAFHIRRPIEKIRLGDVRTKFPLPGNYHFRFKRGFRKSYVWYDVADDYAVVPNFQGILTCKVVRLSSSDSGRSAHNNSRANISGTVKPRARVDGNSHPSRVPAKKPIERQQTPPKVQVDINRRNSGDLLASLNDSPKHGPASVLFFFCK